MKNKIWVKILVLLIFIFGCLSFLYVYMAEYYYKDKFNLQTWVNGCYITGMTVEEANEKLLKSEDYEKIILTKDNETVGEYLIQEFDFQQSFQEPLAELLNNQANYSFWQKIAHMSPVTIEPVVVFDIQKAEEIVLSSSLVTENKNPEQREYIIQKADTGYEILDETKDVIDPQALTQVVISALSSKKTSVDISSCYYDMEVTTLMEVTNKLFEKINQFQNFQMTYIFGTDKEELTPAVVSNWITLDSNGNFVYDEDGNFILNQDKVMEYINYLGDKYDTLGITRTFHSTSGRDVTIEGGTYGNQLDREAEFEYLVQAFLEHKEGSRIPVYLKKALYQGLNDIGDTYIEIDMTLQTLYFYEKGTLTLETPVVTGNIKWNMGTPARVCYVYTKQRNRVLKGPNYAAFVSYWMPVNGSIGIHDAKWRTEFGGEIYKTEGSHGCINTPYDVMKELYGLVEIGTPVIMFY